MQGGNTGFRLQNQLLSAATGMGEDAWKLMDGQSLTIEGVDVTVTDQNSSGYCAYQDGLSGSTVIYTYQVNSDGFFCVDLNMPKRNSISIWKNGVELYSETMSLPQMLAVGDVSVGDVVQVRATCKAEESGTITVTAAILNEERMRACYEALAVSTLELTDFSNTRVSGTIYCNRDGLLYTSIPQNGNWSVKVDGQEAEIVLTGDVMVGVMLTAGSHQVEFIYHNAAFSLGWKISLACAAVFAILASVYYPPQSRRGKFEAKKQDRR